MTEKMKPSGIAWIGHIPNEWGCKQIAFMADSRSGGTPDRNNLTYWENGTIPWMSSGEVNKVNVYETDEKITELATRNSSAKIVKANAVMVALNGQGKTKGMSAILRIDSACNQSLCAFSCHEGILHYEYLFWCFQTMYTYLRQMSGDDVRDGLAASYVKKQKIPVPEYEEQCAIADFLDTQCAKIDSVIADIEKQIETLQKYKKSLITETVTKGLDRCIPMKDSGVKDINDVPQNWNVQRLKYVSRLKTGTTPSGNEGVNYDEQGTPWFTPADFNPLLVLEKSEKFIDEETIHRENITPYPAGSVLLVAIGATVGKIGITRAKGYSNQQITAIIPVGINSKYLLYYLYSKAEFIKDNALYTTLPIINNAYLSNIPVTIPPKQEQLEIAEFLDKKCSLISEIISGKEDQLRAIQQHKKSLIYEYVTGKKRVTEVN